MCPPEHTLVSLLPKIVVFTVVVLSFLSLSLSLSPHLPPFLPPPATPQIEDISLIYYRRDDNDIKYLDLDASMKEQVADLDLICDK